MGVYNLRNDERESNERHMGGRAVREGYVQSHDAGGNSGIEWGGIGDNGGFVESRNHHGAAGVTSK